MFQYKPGFIPSSFVVIGGGGTGGRLVPLLAQFIKTVNWVENAKIYVIDHDAVEEKNLLRQNFIKLDLNKHKAVVLADRYSKAFGANIVPVVKQVDDYRTFGEEFVLDEFYSAETSRTNRLTLGNIKNAIIIMCVDSVAARHSILNHLFSDRTPRNLFIIDAGNGNDFGQVVVYNDSYYQAPGLTSQYFIKEETEKLPLDTPHGKLIPFDVELPIIPFPHKFYLEMADGPEKSCADLDQTLAINAAMATTIMGIVQNFIYVNKRIQFHKLNINLLHGVVAEYITFKYLVEAIYGKVDQTSNIFFPRATDPTKVLDFINVEMRKFRNGQESRNEKSSTQDVEKKVTA